VKRRRRFSVSSYNNRLIAKVISIFFTDVEKRGEEREENLALMQVTSWAQKDRHPWTQTKVYVRKNRKEKRRHGTT
jgi:hypothetical protein